MSSKILSLREKRSHFLYTILQCKEIAAYLATSAIFLLSGSAYSAELSGYIGAQEKLFFEDPLSPVQHNSYLSAVAEPEFFHDWDDGTQNLEVKLFYRADQHDDQRTHGDIRELSWTGVFEHWEVRAGISKVFWGVAETQHLVDVVNQTDLVENLDGEDKLGQAMIRTSTERDWGTLDFYILPGFRERTFPGAEGRPRPNVVIDTEQDAIYDFSDGNDHIDLAARYSHYIGEWEFGLSVFNGTGREPSDFRPVAASPVGEPVVVPVYSLINQIGFDGQAFFGDWTWKLEAINTSDKRIYENTIFDNDLATALRFVFNDAQSTEVLAGFTTDADTQSIGSFIEASHRLGESWTLEAQLRAFHGTKEDRPLYSFRFDDFAQIDLNYHF
jgi:hypothetical protein